MLLLDNRMLLICDRQLSAAELILASVQPSLGSELPQPTKIKPTINTSFRIFPPFWGQIPHWQVMGLQNGGQETLESKLQYLSQDGPTGPFLGIQEA